MATDFGDPSLFEEFEKDKEPSDRILLTKFEDEITECSSKNRNDVDFNSIGGYGEKGSSSESDWEEENAETETTHETGHVEHKQRNGDSEREKRNAVPCDKESDIVKKLRKEIMRLQQEVTDLRHDKAELRAQANVITPFANTSATPGSGTTGGEGPLVQVVYMDNTFSRRHRPDIESFLDSLVRQDKDISLPPLNHTNSVLLGTDNPTATPEEKIQQIGSAVAISCSQLYRHFVFDKMGWPMAAYVQPVIEGWNVPYYPQAFSEPLPVGDSEGEAPQTKESRRPKPSCFNCGGSHNLNECKQRRDHRKIAENRQIFQSKMSEIKMKQAMSRYLETTEDPRFANFFPGEISSELRAALGLSDKELPPYIYQMRLLGYPPGHLEAAKMQTSGISMFDKHGKETTGEGENVEEEDGEVDFTPSPANNGEKFDGRKLISYPGFNVPVPEGVIDDYKKLRMPPMQEQHRKEVLELYFSPKTPSSSNLKRSSSQYGGSSGKRQKLHRAPDAEYKSIDMDTSEGDEPRQVTSTSVANSASSSRVPSPSSSLSLDELEDQRRQLERQLQQAEGIEDGITMEIVDSYDAEEERGLRKLFSPSAEELAIQEKNREGLFVPPLPPTPERPPLPSGSEPDSPNPNSSVDTPKSSKTPVLNLNVAINAARSSIGGSSPSSVFKTPDGARTGQLLLTPSTGGTSLSCTPSTPILNSAREDFGVVSSQDTLKGLPGPEKFGVGVSEHIPFENLPGATGSFDRIEKILRGVRSGHMS